MSSFQQTPLRRNDFSEIRIFTTVRFDRQLWDSPQNHVGSVQTPFYMLRRHYDRIVTTATALEWATALSEVGPMEQFQQQLDEAVCNHLSIKTVEDASPQSPLRVRYAIDIYGSISIDISGLAELPLTVLYPEALKTPPAPDGAFKPSPLTGGALHLGSAQRGHVTWALAIDTKQTTPGPATSFKTERRDAYAAATARCVPEHMQYDGYGGTQVLLVDDHDCVFEGTSTSVYFFRDGHWITPEDGKEKGQWGPNRGTTRAWAIEKGLCVEGRVERSTVSLKEGIWLSNGARGFIPGEIVGLNGFPSNITEST